VAPRYSLDDLDISLGKRIRLHRILYEHGPGGGRALILPIDQGLEHGPVDFFPNPPAGDPEFQLKLALEGGYSAIVFQVGPAEKYVKKYAGRVPLILKINGKTSIPPDNEAFSPLTATVEDGVRLGADAIGYTLYVGSPSQDRDFIQFQQVRRDAERYGMPVVMWAYPRGEAVEKKGGRDSFYAVDYAARIACELGTDVVKINLPQVGPKNKADCPKPYNEIEMSQEEAVKKVVESAGKTLVLISGGSKLGDEDLLYKAKICIEAGVTGLIFGRNMWQRPFDEALAVTGKIKKLIQKH